MTTTWAHLPNAVHIDRVLASSKANPKQWTQRRWVCASWSVAWDLLIKQGRYSVWLESREAAWNAVRDSMNDTLLALIAYDDCAYMLDSDPGELAILAAFGDPRAGMLLLACNAFHSLKTIA